MFNKVIKIGFCVSFMLMLLIPLCTTNLKKNEISTAENRVLTQMAELYNEDGTLNKNFTSDFEAWINDNIGLRSWMVVNNAKMQFHLFDVLANNSDMYLGPNGELNYATNAMLRDYQHLNLYPDSFLERFADSMQKIKEYVEEKGSKFYYYQCWDKHSIYPEYFPDTVIQYGEYSKTDGIVNAISKYSDVKVISPKEELIIKKADYDTYSEWGDATHWTQRGAWIGYRMLMEAINSDSSIRYKILEEEDYNINFTDQGSTLFGGIHRIDKLENFEIKYPKAELTNEKLGRYAEDPRHRFFTNNGVDNRTRLLVIGDSYFNNFIIDDFAESFYETIIIWGDYLGEVQNILDTFNADIVVIEAAERVDRTSSIINGAENIKRED